MANGIQYVLFTGDDVGGLFTRKFYVTIDTELDLTDCVVQFTICGVTKVLMNVSAGERKEIVFSRVETASFGVGVRLATLSIFDPQGRYRTIANDIPVRCTDVVSDVYDGENNLVRYSLDCGVAWDAITGKPALATPEEVRTIADGIEVDDNATQRETRAALQTLLDRIRNFGVACLALFALPLLALPESTEWQDVPPTSKVSSVVREFSPPADFTTNNVELTNTIAQVAPAPGNYNAVSNAAMGARSMTDFSVNTNGWVMSWPDGHTSWMRRVSQYEWTDESAYLSNYYEWYLNVPGVPFPLVVAGGEDAKELSFTGGYSLRRGSRIALDTDIKTPDYSTSNQTLVNTINAVAPSPGNYAAVSNNSMKAVQMVEDYSFLYNDEWITEGARLYLGNYSNDDDYLKEFLFTYAKEPQTYVFRGGGSTTNEVAYTSDISFAADAATNYTDWAIQHIDPAIPVFDVYAADVTNVADFVTSNAISTNNPDFVSAVLAAPIAGADPSDLAEIGEYGSYGTVGAAILALIAGLAALKRGKADKTELPYDIVTVTPSNGVVTVLPRTVATYTAGDSAAAFTVDVGTGETGKARDCELVIDCTATGAVAPTVTWPATFHPRTDEDDFACEAGVRNVYYISEYATGEFVVGGWQETTGGNA